MIVVVGGAGRRSGKTTAMCEIISATREACWTAIKLTSHQHQQSTFGDTERYLAAGASQALLVSELPDDLQGNLIIESNSVLALLTPDVFVFVDGVERKPSAERYVHQADYVLPDGRVTPEIIERIRAQPRT